MAVSYLWPTALPQKPISSSYSESKGARVLVTPMELGPEKMRRRGVMSFPFNVTFLMNDTQVSALETFVLDTIGAVARFGFPSPLGGAQIEARIIPQGSGVLYESAYLGPNLHRVTLTMMEMP